MKESHWHLASVSIEWNAPEKTNCYSTFNLVEQWRPLPTTYRPPCKSDFTVCGNGQTAADWAASLWAGRSWIHPNPSHRILSHLIDTYTNTDTDTATADTETPLGFEFQLGNAKRRRLPVRKWSNKF